MKGLLDTKEDDKSTFGPARHQARWIKTMALLASVISVLFFCLNRPLSRTGSYPADTSGPFHWKQCSNDSHYLCGYLTVPLDYTNSSDSRTVDIATTLYQVNPGHKTERTLVIEPGGPGGSGTAMLWSKGKLFGEMYTDDQLDVLGFDPRGVNLSSPAISCFPHDGYRDRWEWVSHTWPETVGELALDNLDAMSEAVMRGCKEKFGDIPRFMTTAFVARDVDAIREALGEETLTGFMVSYGTGIGQTYAQMFPNRIGALVLDGMEYVRDGWEPWGWGLTSLDNVTDAFEDGFVGECVTAGPASCALATLDPPSADQHECARATLSKQVRDIFEATRRRPIPGVSSQGPGIVTYEHLVEWLYSTLYHPGDWKEAAETLARLKEGNATLALDAIHRAQFSYNPTRASPEDEVFPGHYSRRYPESSELQTFVICGDSYDAERKSLDWWKGLHQGMISKSWISGSPRLYNTLECRHYNWEPAEVYRGNFTHSLHRPLLLIGSPYDPATPLRNARRLAAEMENNARLIVHGGYGHSSARDLSSCTNAHVRAYILNGTILEEAETHCKPDGKPFDVDFAGLRERW